MFDVNTKCKAAAEKVAKDSFETLTFLTHRMNDYFSEAQLYKKSLKEKSFVMEEQYRNRDYVTELTRILKETEEKEGVTSLTPGKLSKKRYDYMLDKHRTKMDY